MWRSLISAGVMALALTAPAGAHPPTVSKAQKRHLAGSTVILYGQEHKERAEALAQALGVHRDLCLPITDTPRQVDGLTTLTVWGHGTQEKFCELNALVFSNLLRNWKVINDKLTKVEMFTCDVRHQSQNTQSDAYSSQVVANVKMWPGKKVKIMALPLGAAGQKCSTLWANFTTYCYITAVNQNVLGSTLTDLIEEAKKTTPMYNFAQAANKLKQKSGYSLIYGSLSGMQSRLVEVR
jgi:hypothetical protein